MSNFYVLEFSDFSECSNRIKASAYNKDLEKVKNLFKKGESILDIVKPPFTAIVDERNSITKYAPKDRMFFSSSTGSAWLLSDKAKRILENLGLPIEFFPICIKGRKMELEGYFLANVIGRIKCIDFNKSKIDYDDEFGYVELYESLVLDECKIPIGTDVFLLGEDVTMLVIVSKKVKEVIEDAGLTGFVFVEPINYSTF